MKLLNTQNTETNKYELEIAVDPEQLEAACQRAYLKNKSKINIPGFRKGKAPRKMIEKLYGDSFFYDDAINDLYPAALTEAVAEAKLDVVAVEKIEPTEVGKDKGFTFKALCIVKPEVEVSNYKGIKVTKTVKAVTEEDINEELSRLQERNSRMISVEGRAAENGDTVVFDFEGFGDGEAFAGGKAEGDSLVLGSGQFIPGFEDQIVGHTVDESFDVNVSFPEDYHEESLKGKPAVFKCKLHEIKTKELPELDDEFAKDVSEFDTLDELKKDIESKKAHDNEHEAEHAVENQLIDTVLENMTAEIPEVMYEQRVDDLVRDFGARLQSQGMALDLYIKYTGMDMDGIRKTFRVQAEKQVKVRLAMEKIAKLENIEVTAEELDAEYKEMATHYNIDPDKIKRMIPEEDVKGDLSIRKAIDFVKDNAKITAGKTKKAASKTEKAEKAEKAEKEEKEEKTE